MAGSTGYKEERRLLKGVFNTETLPDWSALERGLMYLEMFDCVSGEILARIIDAKVVGDNMHVRWANRVTNTADAKRTIRQWAKRLRESYDKSHSNK